ncbi:MAG: DNA polymerase III subunit chi [Alphaproteobacteria bacterium]|nr:DNA polymerase III subunit chi [Alphaproteobacteria bacterium]
MSRVDFYHLTRSSLESALPRLLEKVLKSGARAVVMVGSDERVEALNAHLWTYDDRGFLPHGSAKDGHAAEQPIWLTNQDENPNAASVLVMVDGSRSQRLAEYDRCLEMFDGRDDDAVAAARRRWAEYRDAGHQVSYFQQNERGGWEEKA